MTEQHENDGRDLNEEASSEEQAETDTDTATTDTPEATVEAEAEAAPVIEEESTLDAITDAEETPAPIEEQGAEDTEVSEASEDEAPATEAVAEVGSSEEAAAEVAASDAGDTPTGQDAPAEEAPSGDASPEGEQAGDSEGDASSKEGGKRRRRRNNNNKKPPMDLSPELDQLVELSTKYPDIGPALAQLAYKLDRRDIGDRVVRMGLNDEQRGVEFYFVAADAARRQGRHDDAIGHVVEALESFAASPEGADANERQRLLRLVRRGFQVLMFDVEDVESRPQRTVAIRERLEARFSKVELTEPVWLNIPPALCYRCEL